MAPLLPYLPEPQKSQVLTEALADLPEIEDEGFRGEALARLVPYLPDPQRAKAVNEVLALVPALRWHVRWGILVNMARPERPTVRTMANTSPQLFGAATS
jgi:hypothetical protein